MVLDDSRFEFRFISHILEQSVDTLFEIVEARTLSQALELLSRESFDVVLANLVLPDAEGLEAVRRLARVAPEMATVVLTKIDSDEMALQAIRAGAQEYLVKNETIAHVLSRTLRLATERQQVVVALREAQLEAHHQATHDGLTGLPNRFLFHDRLRTARRRAQRYGRQFALLFIDLDDFKSINDKSGHHAGDTALKTMAQILRVAVRSGDTVARYAGDEFVVIQNEVDGLLAVELLAGRIAAEMMATRIGPTSSPPSLRASIGAAVFPLDGEDDETLLKAADRAMYRAKERGGDRCVLSSQGLEFGCQVKGKAGTAPPLLPSAAMLG
jgi:diguanylate cyclase (GGDEF)-like protein